MIANCGVINPNEPMGLNDIEGTPDVFPIYPDDTDYDFTNVLILVNLFITSHIY